VEGIRESEKKHRRNVAVTHARYRRSMRLSHESQGFCPWFCLRRQSGHHNTSVFSFNR
jgi:hypothetical protein